MIPVCAVPLWRYFRTSSTVSIINFGHVIRRSSESAENVQQNV